MKTRMIVSFIGLAAVTVLATVLLLTSGGRTGEYHVGGQLLCFDCHTMHFSMQHGFDGGAVAGTPAPGGNWLGASGPNHYLLKMPANDLCKSCHDGQTFAPDVVAANTNASPANGREAGALNEQASGAPYDTWKGHTLGSTAKPPGYDPAKINLGATWYTGETVGLECLHCHTQHGRAPAYRNLGPRALTAPTYHIAAVNDLNSDVWINLASYTAGSGVAGTFNPYYATANIFFNRNDGAQGLKYSNRIGTFCAACHANFHGGPGDATVGGTGTPAEEFIRHPTAQVSIGALSGGHSSLSRYVAATTKVKGLTKNYTTYAETSPGCITCHKAHGNQNPFGLIFLNRFATSVNEEGGLGQGQVADVPTGYRNLCGQCHGQGN